RAAAPQQPGTQRGSWSSWQARSSTPRSSRPCCDCWTQASCPSVADHRQALGRPLEDAALYVHGVITLFAQVLDCPGAAGATAAVHDYLPVRRQLLVTLLEFVQSHERRTWNA